MKKIILASVCLGILFITIVGIIVAAQALHQKEIQKEKLKEQHWLLLHRKSNKEFLYFGIAGNKTESKLLKTFLVKSGIPHERPTPLPSLLGRKYWIITDKHEETENPETAPYFLTLDVPVSEEEPFGPSPYLECNGQCNWVLPGYFGLHGSGGDSSKLSQEDPGSSGCIRHSDQDITYLYNALDPKKEEIRYYIEDL
jgi:lipoprotein-anchoring transpeptidase ErfK/SrfK